MSYEWRQIITNTESSKDPFFRRHFRMCFTLCVCTCSPVQSHLNVPTGADRTTGFTKGSHTCFCCTLNQINMYFIFFSPHSLKTWCENDQLQQHLCSKYGTWIFTLRSNYSYCLGPQSRSMRWADLQAVGQLVAVPFR